MAVYIDDGTVMRLIHTALLAVTGIEVIVLGEPIPDDLDSVAIAVGMTIERMPRVSNTDAAMAKLSVEVACCCGPGQTSTSAIGELCAKVAKALDTVSALVDSGTTHAIELETPTVTIGVEVGDNPGNKGGRVTCAGTVRRDSGETIASFIT